MQSSNHGVKGNKKIAHPPPLPDNNSPPPIADFFSSQNRNMDYVTLSGISERTGIGKDDLPKFVLKELLDNAVDFIEGQGPVSKKEKKSDSDKITVTFDINSSEGQQHCLILKVRNSIRSNNNQISFKIEDNNRIQKEQGQVGQSSQHEPTYPDRAVANPHYESTGTCNG